MPIQFSKKVLSNGLRVIIHRDESTPMAAVNILYNVGSRDEHPDRTGFAHLFEHLMFSGSETVKDYDEPLQLAGGENNAFTNTDTTNFHINLPANNLEVAFWLESDRMRALKVDARSLRTQQRVVIEEFKEVILNEPYGDIWHHLSALAYKKHSYRWPVIGLTPDHIEQANAKDVKDFYRTHYVPSNAIICICSPLEDAEVLEMVEKWFGHIPAGNPPKRVIPREPIQRAQRRKVVKADVPVPALYMAFPMAARMDDAFYPVDLLSDVLGFGASSRLYQKLVKDEQIFSGVDAYVTASLDPGLLVIEGRPAENVSLQQAENAIWQVLTDLKTTPVETREFEKLLNKVEANFAFSEGGVLNKAINLSLMELMGDPNLINTEMDAYRRLDPASLSPLSATVLAPERANVLWYEVN
jgi:zinc protease